MRIDQVIGTLSRGKTLQKHYAIPNKDGHIEYLSIGIRCQDQVCTVRRQSYTDTGQDFFLETGFDTVDQTFSSIDDALAHIKSLGFDITDFGPAKGSRII